MNYHYICHDSHQKITAAQALEQQLCKDVVLQSSALQAMQNQLGELHQQISRPGLDAFFFLSDLFCFKSE